MPPDERTHTLRLGPPRADVPSTHADGAPPSAPSSHVRASSRPSRPPSPRFPTPFQQVTEALRELYPAELAEVSRFIDKLRAARGAACDPNLVSRVLAELRRMLPSYRDAPGVPVSRLRVELPEVPRCRVDEALLDAERRGLLRLLPVSLPSPFVEPSAGVPSSRGLLYFVAPAAR